MMKIGEVAAMTRRSRSSLYDDMKRGAFVRPVKLGPRSIAFVRSEVEAWLDARVAERAA